MKTTAAVPSTAKWLVFVALVLAIFVLGGDAKGDDIAEDGIGKS